MSPARLRWTLLGSALAVHVGFVVGAFDPSPHTGGDNSGYLSLAYALLTTGSYVELFDPAGLPHTKYPPLFPGLLALLMWLGARTWVAFKAVAAVASVAVVGFTFLWAERRVGIWPAFIVSVLVAMSPSLVYYSHWILSDPVFFALTMAALWALDDRSDADGPNGRWWVVGVAAVGLAYFTRSAGIPLVVAVAGTLTLRRRWKALGIVAVALGVPIFLWWLRGAGAGATYASEFWMADPYDPGRGTIAVWGLIPRVAANLRTYVLEWGPFGVMGRAGVWGGVLGVLLTLATSYAWVRAVRERVGIVELFLPLYVALILVWPEVWAGDRFALPLYPVVLVYTTLALRDLSKWAPKVPLRAGVGAALIAIGMAATASWLDATRRASACARMEREAGAFACAGPRVGAFLEAARWAGASLPEGSAVMTRKPRHFYVFSGVPSRTFPFVDDPDVHLATADSVGARFVLLDTWDGLATLHVGGAVVSRPAAFCFLSAFGELRTGGAQLLGIVPAAERVAGGRGGADGVTLVRCTGELQATDAAYSSSPSTRVPLLAGLDP